MVPVGSALLLFVDDLADLAGDGAEVGAVDVGVDIEDGLDVVVVDDDGGLIAAGSWRGFRGAARCCRRREVMGVRPSCGRELMLVDGGLGDDLVVDAVERVEPLVGLRSGRFR